MKKAASQGKFDLWAYVVMPEHVHLVLLPAPGVRVAEILSTVKQSTAKRALLWTRQNAPDFLPTLRDQQPNGKTHYRFWQRGGGYDRNLRSVRDIHEKIAYVHDNPVRRGLVARSADWHWSSAKAWCDGSADPLPICRQTVPPLTITDERTDRSLMGRPD